jgi:ferredoxin-NADP reductase
MNENEKEFNLSIKGNIRDLLAFKNLISKRSKLIQKASNLPKGDPIKNLSRTLHPQKQSLVISEIREETKSTKTYRLISESEHIKLAYFRAGQYLSLKVQVNGIDITRPYSISSSPLDSLHGFYEITIKKAEDGFLTQYIWENWKIGTKIESSGPEGNFYFEPLRDSNHIVGIAGGSGITPFSSIAKSIINETINAKLTVFYGSSEEDDIIFYDKFKEFEKNFPKQIKIIHVLSCEEISLEGCEQGFITAEKIKNYVDVEECSFFICGPQIMYEFVEKELTRFNLPHKKIRKELFGEIKNIVSIPNYPKESIGKTFSIEVEIGSLITEIPALATESVLTALERAKLAPPSKCRSGSCGFCRSALISGDIFVRPLDDKRRSADILRNYFHPCSSYPLSNLKIVVPRAP